MDVLTLTEAAAILKMDRKSVERLLRRGALPGAKVGSRWRINRDDLVQHLRGAPRSQAAAAP